MNLFRVLAHIYKKLTSNIAFRLKMYIVSHKQFSILLGQGMFKMSPGLIDKLTINEIKVDGVAHISVI